MTKEIQVHQQIQPQKFVDEKYHLSTGEVIHDPHQRGMVGWLDQTESEPGYVKTSWSEPSMHSTYIQINANLT